MKTIVKWLNNLTLLTVMAGFGLLVNLVVLGRAYGLNKSDWAAWVQAVGSITAIGAAVWISSAEAQRERKRRQDDEQDEKKRRRDYEIREHARICILLETALNHADNAVIRLTWELKPFKAEALAMRAKGVTASKNLISSFFEKQMSYELSLILTEAYDLLSRGESLATAPVAGANFPMVHRAYAEGAIPELSTKLGKLYERMVKISSSARDDLDRLDAA